MRNDFLAEYVYVDRARLDSYFEQISDPVKYDKVPVWKAGLSLTGPSAEATQNRSARPFTLHEKVTILHGFLEKKEMVKNGREREPFSVNTMDQVFRFERMSARRVFAKSEILVGGRDSLALWYSEALDEEKEDYCGPGPVLLIEDYFGNDDDPTMRWSGYSALGLLVDSLGGYFLDLQGTTDDPVKLLAEAGATFGPKREISVLYRVRAVCMVPGRPGKSLSFTVGYPIVITAGAQPHAGDPA